MILSRAVHGQSMVGTMGLSNQQQYTLDLADQDNWIDGKPDVILVSGGGDDIAGDPFIIYLDYFNGGLSARIQGVLASIEASYKALFSFRDKYAPGTPIIGHCYDYAIPNGQGIPALLLGPWLQPSLYFAGYYDLIANQKLVKALIDDFYQMLNGLQGAANNFTLIDTRGTLTPNTSQPLGWANELHPYTAGFVALADKFLGVLRTKFRGRI